MSAWLAAYERLSDAQKVNVQRWIHLNKFIAQTLKIDERAWFEDWVGDAMRNPLDFSFMEAAIPGFAGLEGPGQGESFVRGGDPFAGPKVALRAANKLGTLSPPLQDAIAGLLEHGEPAEGVRITAQDVASLQKIFRSERALARLKRPQFRMLRLLRDPVSDEMVLNVEDGEDVLRLHMQEFAAILSRDNV
jgi:hypothetical protein